MLALELKRQGIDLRLDTDALIVKTETPLSDELRRFLRQHKPQLIAELKILSKPKRRCCMWRYKLNPQLSEHIQMGLMTDDPVEAQDQLTAIYGKDVVDLHKKDRCCV